MAFLQVAAQLVSVLAAKVTEMASHQARRLIELHPNLSLESGKLRNVIALRMISALFTAASD